MTGDVRQGGRRRSVAAAQSGRRSCVRAAAADAAARAPPGATPSRRFDRPAGAGRHVPARRGWGPGVETAAGAVPVGSGARLCRRKRRTLCRRCRRRQTRVDADERVCVNSNSDAAASGLRAWPPELSAWRVERQSAQFADISMRQRARGMLRSGMF